MLKHVLAWFPMVLIAIVNGAFRQGVLVGWFSNLGAHQVSCLTAIFLFWGYTWVIGRLWPLPSARQALAVGFVWLLLTITFEFGFGHYVLGHPWERLLQEYNLSAGRLWVLVLLAVFLLPWIVYKKPRS